MSRSSIGVTVFLALVGTAALAVATLLPTVVEDRMVRLPADLSQRTVTVGSADMVDAASFLTATAVQVQHNLPIAIVTDTVATGPSSPAWVSISDTITATRTDRTGSGATFFVDNFVAGVDRATYRVDDSPAPAWWTSPSTTASPEPQRADTYLSFPSDTDKISYRLYDVRGHAPVVAEYVDEDREIQGLRTYHFRATLPPVDTTTTLGFGPQTELTMPAFKWGLPGGTEPVTMRQYYANTRDIWVEPTTGATLDIRTTPHTYFARSATDEFTIDAFKADLRFDDATVQALVDKARDGRRSMRLVFLWLPIGLGIIGVALIGTAATRFARARRG